MNLDSVPEKLVHQYPLKFSALPAFRKQEIGSMPFIRREMRRPLATPDKQSIVKPGSWLARQLSEL